MPPLENRLMKEAKQVLFIQGGGEGAFLADKPLAESLRKSLGADYQVHYPAMPNEDDPNDEMWRAEIRRQLEKIGGDTLLVGHSVGAYVLVRFMVQDRGRSTLPGVFLIATPFFGEGGWQASDLALPEGFAEVLPPAVPIFLYHARDDDVVPFAHLGLYRQKIRQATVRELESGGHQLNNDLSIVAADIRRLPYKVANARMIARHE
jgi:predicted alpha/beta hydrolase family esterase